MLLFLLFYPRHLILHTSLDFPPLLSHRRPDDDSSYMCGANTTWVIFSWYSSCTTTRLANATTDIYGAPYEISISICFTFIAGYIRFLNDILRDYHDYNVHDQSPYISNFLRSVDAIITTRTRKRWRLSFRSPSRSHSYPENVGFPLVYEWSFYSTITVPLLENPFSFQLKRSWS